MEPLGRFHLGSDPGKVTEQLTRYHWIKPETTARVLLYDSLYPKPILYPFFLAIFSMYSASGFRQSHMSGCLS
jgi:hypothetical protein